MGAAGLGADSGLLVEGAERLFGGGDRGDWKDVIQGKASAEEIVERRIDQIIEEEEIFASEGL